MKIDSDTLDLIFQFAVLPGIVVILGTVGAIAFDSVRTNRAKTRAVRDEEIKGAMDAYTTIMADVESLFSKMKYNAWNIAWRKARPEGIFSEDLVEEDEIQWKEYNKALSQWRRNKIQHRTSLDFYFGKRNSTSRLFRETDAALEKLSFEIWFIYHENPTNPNIFLRYYVEDTEQHYNSIFNAIMTSIDKEITEEQEDKVHHTTSLAFEELQDTITRLCFEMRSHIRRGNVGSLKKDH